MVDDTGHDECGFAIEIEVVPSADIDLDPLLLDDALIGPATSAARSARRSAPRSELGGSAMATLRFAFEPGGPQRIGVDWQGGWRDVAVTIDGRRLAVFPDGKALREGRRIALADGSMLELKLAQMPLPELQILRDGVPLPGSPSDPAARVRRAGQFVCAIGVFSVALGLFAALFDVGFLRGAGFGLASAVTGALFAALGLPAMRGSVIALVAAVALYVLDGAFTVVELARAGTTSVPVARILFLIPMVQGLRAGFVLRRGSPPARPAPPVVTASAAPARVEVAPSREADATQKRRREIESRARDAMPATGAARDRSAEALRFAAPKLELLEGGVCVVALDGRRREIAWDHVSEVLVRKLPPDPPWNGAVLLDLIVPGEPPVRVMPATLMSFAKLPGGAAPSRLENTRRLARLVVERSGAEIDPQTRAFLSGNGHPTAFATVHEFAQHDARFG